MDIDDLQDQIDTQSATINAQHAEIARLQQELEKKSAPAPAPQASVPKGYTAEQVKALEEKAQQADAALARAEQLQGEKDLNSLKSDFPAITDWEAIKGANIDERRAHAEQVNRMIGGASAKQAEGPGSITADPVVPATPAPNPGEAFGAVAPAGTPSADRAAQEAREKQTEELRANQKSGNLTGVLDSIFKMNPEGTRRLFQS